MKKIILWIAFGYEILYFLNFPFLSDFINTLERAWENLLEAILPVIGSGSSYGFSFTLSTFFFLLIQYFVIVEVVMRRKVGLTNLSLKGIYIGESNRALMLRSTSTTSANVGTNDYLQDICYVETRHNTWLAIILVMLLILAPGFYVASQASSNGALYLAPFVLIAIVVLVYMLRGSLQIGTADGSVSSFSADKLKADYLINVVGQVSSGSFIHISLSGAFTSRDVHFRREQITGVVEVWSFPWGWLLLTILSAVLAYVAVQNGGRYGGYQFLLLVPLILLGITIYLATRRQRVVKMIGMHIYALGNYASVEEILAQVSPCKKC